MPLPRLRLRTLLIAVAVAGTALGGWRMWKRPEYCLRRAAECDNAAETCLEVAQVSTSQDREATEREVAEWMRLLAERYRRVARYPWLQMPRGPE